MAVTGTDITITTRTAKGSALTHAELDENQTGLKDAVEGHSHDEFAAKLGTDDNYMTDAEKAKLADIEAGAKANVQADWNASTGDAAILNKPSIPPAYTLPTASTTVLGGVKVDGTTVLISDGVISSTGGSGGGVTDHGLLTGLSDDDHPQYHNDIRGDARYSQTTHNHSLNNLTEKSYISLTDKPSIPSIAGLLNETAHDALDHSGLPGIPSAYTLPTASTTMLGGIKVDGTTITISNGVASASGSGSGMANPMTAAGDLIIGGTDGAPARLPKGTDGQLLGYVSGTLAAVNTPTGGGSAITVEVSAACTEITITGLDGNAAGGYWLSAEIVGNTAVSLYMRCNGDTTQSNYSLQRSMQNGSTYTGTRATGLQIVDVGASGKCVICGWLTTVDGMLCGAGDAIRGIGPELIAMPWNIAKHNAPVSNITSITIWSDVVDGISAGSAVSLKARR